MAKNDVYEPQFLSLTADNGEELTFEVLDIIEWGGDDYVILFPTDDAADGAVLLRIVPVAEGEAESYEGVDEDTMNAVFSEFRNRHRDELGE